ncbi:uncharacterized protein [Parasteatoda tepidariorum]|uniref:uncharacterized protein n=1 Tax=Parasteatoda tepidariorum TaxID=114398 RepID=UPI001C721EF1|nr:uncharacterized protein LOC107439226 [Parasteatoda tepidariorum]
MDFAEIGGVYAEIAHEEAATLLKDQLLHLRSMLLDMKPMFAVPIEMSMILFILINIYKGIYINCVISKTVSNYYAALTVVALVLEAPVEGNSYQLWAYFAMCVLLPLPMVFHELYRWIATPFFICFSQPLAFCLDEFFLLYTFIRGEEHLPKEQFYNYYGIYFLACSIISAYIKHLVTLHGLTMLAMFFLALYGLASFVFLYVKMGDSMQHSYSFGFRVELVCYLALPYLLAIFYTVNYGEKLTYYIQIFKH